MLTRLEGRAGLRTRLRLIGWIRSTMSPPEHRVRVAQARAVGRAVVLLAASVVIASAEGGWVLWVKSEGLWVNSTEPPAPASLGTFPTKDECVSRMEQAMSQVAAWNDSHGIRVTRDGHILRLRIPSDPPRLATVTYSCVPDAT